MAESIITQFVKSVFGSIFNDVTSFFSRSGVILRYMRYIFLFSLLGSCAIGGYFAYQWYAVHKQRNAQQIFAKAQDEYQAIISTDDISMAQSGIERLIAFESQVAGLKTSFDIAQLRVNALLKHDMHNEAVTVMKEVVNNMSSSPLYDSARVKLALMLLDTTDNKNDGVKLLSDIGYDQQSANNDSALYYLGQYYWINGKLGKASNTWQHLVDQYKDEHISPSPWVNIVQEKLALISFVE
jgi:hypothetical protein